MDTEHLVETTIDSKDIYSGALLQVKKDTARLPDGDSATREWIDHPGAAAVVPVYEDGSTLLIRQFRYAAGRVFLEVPAGKLDPGEPVEKAARRELEEETGVKAGDLQYLGEFYPCIGYSNEVIHIYMATGLTVGNVNLSHGEFIETIRLPLREAVEMGRKGKIADMKTVTALCVAANHLGL